MMEKATQIQRRLGLFDATGIGVGAIVGGGILALAGTALRETGSGAWLAFLFNGGIALLTALSFAELSTAFPHSGGSYLFAKRILSVGAAFNVGWVVWFASIVAAALYAIGFATFFQELATTLGLPLPDGSPCLALALVTTLGCTWWLGRSSTGGTGGINVLKVLVFTVLIAGGAWAWYRDRPPCAERLVPLLPEGMTGMVRAMGYTFIALQGFDLIAAAAGEIKNPRRIIPRAMILSLLLAISIYLPFMLLICMAGIPADTTLAQAVARDPDTIVARAAQVFLGKPGYWLVLCVGLLSMFSALLANLFAASRIAQAMAQDRTLPPVLDRIHVLRGTPSAALWWTCILVCVVLFLVPDVGKAGAAASLIFLVSFTLVHVMCLLVRKRKADHSGYHVPAWPVLPLLGLVTCLALAVFQGLAVPAAGLIVAAWLIIGFFCYLWVFGRRARVYDAASETVDPDLLELRGRSPLVLVPIANPANASAMALLAACITAPRVGRVLLLNVGRLPALDADETGDDLETTSEILKQSMRAALRERIRVESLATIANDPWIEIERVARVHRCASVLLGMASLRDDAVRGQLESLASRLPGNVVVFRAPSGWHPRVVRKVLVPVGGRIVHNALRARLLNGLHRRVAYPLVIEYLLVLPPATRDAEARRMQNLWSSLVRDETSASAEVRIMRHHDICEAVVEAATHADLVVLGLRRTHPQKRVFGPLTTHIVENLTQAVIVIGQRD